MGEEDPAGHTDGNWAPFRWIVDPLGRHNELCPSVSRLCRLGRLGRGGVEVAGAVFDPVANECYTAAAGQGAFLNGRPLGQRHDTVFQALVAASFAAKVTPGSPMIDEFAPGVAGGAIGAAIGLGFAEPLPLVGRATRRLLGPRDQGLGRGRRVVHRAGGGWGDHRPWRSAFYAFRSSLRRYGDAGELHANCAN